MLGQKLFPKEKRDFTTLKRKGTLVLEQRSGIRAKKRSIPSSLKGSSPSSLVKEKKYPLTGGFPCRRKDNPKGYFF